MCSVVILGKQVARETYGDLKKRTPSLQRMVLESHHALAEATGAQAIVLEGAGSCTELNLMDRDVVNLPLVRSLGVRLVLYLQETEMRRLSYRFLPFSRFFSVPGYLLLISIAEGSLRK